MLDGLWVCFHGYCLEGIGKLKLREGLIVSMKRSSEGIFFLYARAMFVREMGVEDPKLHACI